MSCHVKGCSEKIETICESHQDPVSLCSFHSYEHRNQTDHPLRNLNDKKPQVIIEYTFNSQIQRSNVMLAEEGREVFEKMKEVCSETVIKIVNIYQNCEDISDFKMFVFNSENFLFLIKNYDPSSEDSNHSTSCLTKDPSENKETSKNEPEDAESVLSKWEQKMLHIRWQNEIMMKNFTNKSDISFLKERDKKKRTQLKIERKIVKVLKKIEELVKDLTELETIPSDKRTKRDKILIEFVKEKLEIYKGIEKLWRISNGKISNKEIKEQVNNVKSWIEEQEKRISDLINIEELKNKNSKYKKIPLKDRSSLDISSILINKKNIKFYQENEKKSRKSSESFLNSKDFFSTRATFQKSESPSISQRYSDDYSKVKPEKSIEPETIKLEDTKVKSDQLKTNEIKETQTEIIDFQSNEIEKDKSNEIELFQSKFEKIKQINLISNDFKTEFQKGFKNLANLKMTTEEKKNFIVKGCNRNSQEVDEVYEELLFTDDGKFAFFCKI